MQTASPYPVIAERSLRPVPRKLLRGARRDPAELPEQPPGTVLVFHTKGGYQAFAERRHLTGSEEAVVQAVAVSVVDVRGRYVLVGVPIPSSDLAHDFPVQVTFRCTVKDAARVVEEGPRDLHMLLGAYLREDLELQKMGLDWGIEGIHRLRPLVVARVKAFFEVVPPQVEGVEVALSSVDVLLPADVKDHARGMKGMRWEEEANDLRAAIESKDVARIEAFLHRGNVGRLALGISRNAVPIADAVTMLGAVEEQQAARIFEVIRALPEGALDFLPIDTRALFQEAMRVAGVNSSATSEAPPLEQRGAGKHSEPRPLGLEESDD
ncbi:hypothetical protein ACTMTF_40975 [Nonomuraea sp. ZG12]|uniref:hypothetical protein n=1 Tax=Nonomuraea sp. ZG12 TaxID=3452207 RepID=UPI003F8868F2